MSETVVSPCQPSGIGSAQIEASPHASPVVVVSVVSVVSVVVELSDEEPVDSEPAVASVVVVGPAVVTELLASVVASVV
ncbi:MAG: hypothetical protein KC431_17820, partial [Myxococcales bacterium]|nr:hypothetical protein [Myxococcales bacterium]